MHAGDQFGGLFIGSIAADNRAVDFQKLRGFSKDSGECLVVHAGIIKREGQRLISSRCSEVDGWPKRKGRQGMLPAESLLD